MLSDFYGEVSDDLEIVFVSSDRSPDDMISYMKESHGDWCGVEHNSALANDLKQKYGVQGIPMLGGEEGRNPGHQGRQISCHGETAQECCPGMESLNILALHNFYFYQPSLRNSLLY